MHSTNGPSATYEEELTSTLNWFASRASQVSAHIVIAWNGDIYEIVPDNKKAWHCRELNEDYLGAELVKPETATAISDAQYDSLAWWLQQKSVKFGFALTAETLPEHRETVPGIREGKIDIGGEFIKARLLAKL